MDRPRPPSDPPRRTHHPDVDDMSAQSFPASDPPAVWTWDVVPQVEPSPPPGRPPGGHDVGRGGGRT